MIEVSTTQNLKGKQRGKIIPLTSEELAPINARLREAYRLVDEVGLMIRGHVKWNLERRHRDMHWELRMIGENLNNRIDCLEEDEQ